jgi:hypothetical protein
VEQGAGAAQGVRWTGYVARVYTHHLHSRALRAARPVRAVSGAKLGVEVYAIEGEAEVTFANASVNGIASVPENALWRTHRARYHP